MRNKRRKKHKGLKKKNFHCWKISKYQILQKSFFEPNFESFSTMLRTSFSKNNIFFGGGVCAGRAVKNLSHQKYKYQYKQHFHPFQVFKMLFQLLLETLCCWLFSEKSFWLQKRHSISRHIRGFEQKTFLYIPSKLELKYPLQLGYPSRTVSPWLHLVDIVLGKKAIT